MNPRRPLSNVQTRVLAILQAGNLVTVPELIGLLRTDGQEVPHADPGILKRVIVRTLKVLIEKGYILRVETEHDPVRYRGSYKVNMANPIVGYPRSLNRVDAMELFGKASKILRMSHTLLTEHCHTVDLEPAKARYWLLMPASRSRSCSRTSSAVVIPSARAFATAVACTYLAACSGS